MTNNQKVNRIYTEQDSLVINEPQEEVNRETSVHHNLQNPSPTRCQVNSQTELITRAISSIINGRLSRQNASKLVNLKTSAKKKVESITLKKPVSNANIKHKIFIIGDSHVRGLADKVRNDLNDGFSVIAISKLNADIDGIISPINFFLRTYQKMILLYFMVALNISVRMKQQKIFTL
jgi:hypothetical protein